jgi:hypothetical protein
MQHRDEPAEEDQRADPRIDQQMDHNSTIEFICFIQNWCLNTFLK